MAPPFSFRPRVLLIAIPGDARTFLRWLLDSWGYRVDMADDAASGLSKALAWSPEAAIIGVGASTSDGYEIGAGLRAVFGSGVFLLARAPCGQMVDRSRAFESGFDDVFDGDADPSALRAQLAAALGEPADRFKASASA
jgi:DNA-binding response OmpR family regulator